MHGLRHAYAQNRYEKLTGWKAPAAGGPDSKALNQAQRETDRQARPPHIDIIARQSDSVTR